MTPRGPAAEFSTAEHRQFFADFIKWEMAVGGPDPHLATVGKMMEGESWAERVWRCGLYASGYNVPTAEIIWREFPWERMRRSGAALDVWVHEHWPEGFGLRRERRAVRTAEKFSRCLYSIANWTQVITDARPDWWGQSGPEAYDAAWRSTGEIYGLGRYVQLKFVEALVRYADGAFAQTDIRAHGGTSPREGLALLYPQHEAWLTESSSRHVEGTEALAESLKHDLFERDGLNVGWFVLQVVLCEYKKTFQRKQYPGRTHDTEVKYLRAMERYWHHESDMFAARAALFAPTSLGEVSGWEGAREDLEDVLADHRYQWTDVLYDYHATRAHGAYADPVRWGEDRGAPPVVIETPTAHGAGLKLAKVYQHTSGGALYQTGARNLVKRSLSDRVRALDAHDIVMILNVSPNADDELAVHVTYEHYPFGDNSQFRGHVGNLESLAARAAERVRQGHGVLTHCEYGVNRSGLLNALIIRELERCTGADALGTLRARRRGACGGNHHFEEFLDTLGAPA